LFAAARYGPNEDITSQQQQQPEDDDNVVDVEQKEWERAETARLKRQQQELQSLVQAVMTTTNPQHVPSIMTKHMELLLNIRGYEGSQLIESILKEAEAQGEAHVNQVMDAIEFILSFTEAFVDNAQTLDDYNKKLLGKIIKTMSNLRELIPRDRELIPRDRGGAGGFQGSFMCVSYEGVARVLETHMKRPLESIQPDSSEGEFS
jgi:hypothetical protein